MPAPGRQTRVGEVWPGSATRLAAVIGSPVRHSLSPAIHNAAFAACGLDWAYLAFDVPADGAAAAVAGCRALGLGGLSVTMPLKAAVAGLVDARTPVASALGAVNTLVFGPERTTGDNTDGPGFLAALAAERGWEPRHRRCLVLGAGGAARAVVLALADAGAAEVVVVNRSRAPAVAAAELAGVAGRVGVPADVAHAELVVNATPVGMEGTPGAGAVPVDPALLHPDQLVVDLVYHPVSTPLLQAAAARGAECTGGVDMLVHQAALQFAGWTGVDPPLEAMAAAARSALLR